jgi:hypothetical protein
MAGFCLYALMMKYLSFDLRALALMRICLAAVIIVDLSIRLSDLEAFYSDTGAVPLSMLFDHAWNKYYFSFHVISGLWQLQLVLFVFALFCALMLLIGYRTKLFTILSWLMMVSLHNRNVFILQGGDDLMRMVLFWGMFIPWGVRYSCDRLLDPVKEENVQIRSLGTFAYILQICFLYTGSALLKGTEWHTDYSAVYYAYSIDQIAYPITESLYYYPKLLKILTFTAYYFELLVPLLFFIPFRHSLLRSAGVICIILFHSWNAMTLLIGIFPFAGMATSLGILSSSAMDKLDELTFGIKRSIADSFKGIAFAVQYIIKWKPSWYATGGLHQHITTAVLIFLMVFITDWNISNLNFVTSKTPQWIHPLAYILRIDQSWGMFAPGVLKDDGWYVFEGTCADGSCINLLSSDKDISYKKPAKIVSMFKNDRWRKYTENYIFIDNDFMRPYFCNYYKRIWNEQHTDSVKTLRVIYMTETTLPDYQYVIPEKAMLCECTE